MPTVRVPVKEGTQAPLVNKLTTSVGRRLVRQVFKKPQHSPTPQSRESRSADNTTRSKPLPATRDAWFLKDISPTIMLSIVYWVWARGRDVDKARQKHTNFLQQPRSGSEQYSLNDCCRRIHRHIQAFFGNVKECSERQSFLWTAPPFYSNAGIWMVARCVSFVHRVLSSCYSALT